MRRWRRLLAAIGACALVAALTFTETGHSHPAQGVPTGGPYQLFVAGQGGVAGLPITNVSNGNIASNPSVAGSPLGVAVTTDARDAVVVSQSGSSTVLTVIDTVTDAARSIPGPAGDPTSIVADPTNPSLLYTGFNGAGVFKLNLSASPSLTPVVGTANDAVTALAVSPDSSTLYVATSKNRVVGIGAVSLVTSASPTFFEVGPNRSTITDLAITPNGRTLIGSEGQNGILLYSTPLASGNPNATDTFAPASVVTVSPDGASVYAAGSGATSKCGGGCAFVEAFPSGNPGATAVQPLPQSLFSSNESEAISVSPDGASLVVAVGENHAGTSLVPVTVAGGGLVIGQPAALPSRFGSGGSYDDGEFIAPWIAMTPDQAPVAQVSAVVGAPGLASTLDASGSTVRFGSVATYQWNFGDGSPPAFSSTPTISHAYATAGVYTASVVETDTAGTSIPPAVAGTSLATDGPGQTAFRLSSASARASVPVVIGPSTTTTTTPPTSAEAVPPPASVTTPTALPPTLPLPVTTPVQPTITLSPTVGPPGTVVAVTGVSFPPGASILLGWTSSAGPVDPITAPATADAAGAFTATMVIVVPEVVGPRTAEALGYPTATASFLVVPSTDDGSYLFRTDGS